METLKYVKLKNSPINYEFKKLISRIKSESITSGQEASPRGLEVKESLITSIEIDSQYPCIDFKDRSFNWKYFAGELAWYLLKSRETYVIDRFSNFWKNIKNEDGSINSNYGNILLTKVDEIKANSSSLKDSFERDLGTSQVAWVVNSLKKDMYSRQAIAYIGGSKFQYEGNKDFVCTQYILFFIRNNELHMKVQMRSNDIFYGLTYDAPWFSTVHQNIYLELLETYPDLRLGRYVHSSDNSHFYKRHFDMADSIESDTSNAIGPKIELIAPLWNSNEDGSTTISIEAQSYIDNLLANIDRLDSLTKTDYINILKSIFKITI